MVNYLHMDNSVVSIKEIVIIPPLFSFFLLSVINPPQAAQQGLVLMPVSTGMGFELALYIYIYISFEI